MKYKMQFTVFTNWEPEIEASSPQEALAKANQYLENIGSLGTNEEFGIFHYELEEMEEDNNLLDIHKSDFRCRLFEEGEI